MFRTHVLIISRSKLHYTVSGIITRIGGRLVHETATYRCDIFFYLLSVLQLFVSFGLLSYLFPLLPLGTMIPEAV